MSILEKGQNILARLRALSGARPPLEKYYVIGLAILIGYTMADTGVLLFRTKMLPTEAPPLRPGKVTRSRMQSLADYNAITERNIFNEDGLIPPSLGSQNEGDMQDRPAVLSQLPIQLLGTIVHFNPAKSIATVSITSKSMSSSYIVDETIEGMATVTKIERKKLTFKNLNNQRMEYIEIPDDEAFKFDIQASTDNKSGDIVEQKGKFDFTIRRSDLESMTQNLSSLLQQARMEPVYSPDGVGVEGFRFVTIQPGSIYEKLGFKIGDLIRSVNGEAVNSPTKAMEMYNILKTSNNVQLGVDRDGREERFNYSIQ